MKKKLEIGKTYDHATANDGSKFKITARFSHLFEGKHVASGQLYLFDENGKAVATKNVANAPLFHLKVEEDDKDLYIRFNVWGSTSLHNDDPQGWAVASIKITMNDGVPQRAELVRTFSNGHKFAGQDKIDKL